MSDYEVDTDTRDTRDRKRARSILHGVKIHIIDINVPKSKLAILSRVVIRNGGTIVDSVTDDDTIILADFQSIEELKAAFEKSKMRKFQYTDEQCRKMCRLEWLTLSIKHGTALSRKSFTLLNTTPLPEDESDSSDNKDTSLLAPGYINDGWACKHRCPLDHPNRAITDALTTIMHHRRVTGDARSELSYAKAIAALAGYPRPVRSLEEAAAIKGIGPKIAALIGEFLEKGVIGAVRELEEDKRYRVMRSLCDIHGVGAKTAERWVDLLGIDSVEAVRAKHEKGDLKLTEQQRLGLLYYDDLLRKMSRSQVENIHELVKSILPIDCELHPTGGYRRGKPQSNDVDILLLSPNINILDMIVSRLDKHIVGVLQLTRSAPPKPLQKPANPGAFDHLGKCLLLLKAPGDETVRRVDIIHVPCRELLPWAQLGWTGSRMFERSIRLYADRVCNIHLSSDGAFCKQSMSYLSADSEEDCFALLRLEFVPPQFRNC